MLKGLGSLKASCSAPSPAPLPARVFPLLSNPSPRPCSSPCIPPPGVSDTPSPTRGGGESPERQKARPEGSLKDPKGLVLGDFLQPDTRCWGLMPAQPFSSTHPKLFGAGKGPAGRAARGALARSCCSGHGSTSRSRPWVQVQHLLPAGCCQNAKWLLSLGCPGCWDKSPQGMLAP